MRAAVCGLSHRSRGSARQRARWPRPAQGRASRGRERYRLHRPRLLATILPSHPRAIRFPPLMNPEIVAGLLFLAIYALIVTEKIHRTLAALLGASLMIVLRIVDQHEAFASVDFNVIFLLAGMMIIANITAKTGVFQWIAVEAVRRAGGRPYTLLVITSIVTAMVSAFLDNVTTVVLLTPVVFFIAQRLQISPVPFLISQVIASNIGGTATLIGDPPNIIIGSQMGKDFNDFLVNLTPAATVALVVYLSSRAGCSAPSYAL